MSGLEAVGVAAGVLSLLKGYQRGIEGVRELRKARLFNEALGADIQEFGVFGGILEELGRVALQSTETSLSAAKCLELCHKNMEDFNGQILARRSDPANVKAAFARVRSSIILLRDIVMDSITHTLLREQRAAQMQLAEAQLDFAKRQSFSYDENQTDLFEDDPTRKEKIDRLQKQLHEQEGRNQTSVNPFTTPIHLIPRKPDEAHEMVMAKLDTQSRRNWVSADILLRFALEDDVVDCEPGWYQGAGGGEFHAEGCIILTWYATLVAKTRKTEFLVNRTSAQFDLILGSDWLIAEGFSAFAEPVLAVYEQPLTDDQHRKMQANMYQRQTVEAEIVPARRAQERDKRQELRLQKTAAKRIASRAHTRSASQASSAKLTRRQSFTTQMPVRSLLSSYQDANIEHTGSRAESLIVSGASSLLGGTDSTYSVRESKTMDS